MRGNSLIADPETPGAGQQGQVSNRDAFEASRAFKYSLRCLCPCLWHVLLPLNLTEGSTQETE